MTTRVSQDEDRLLIELSDLYEVWRDAAKTMGTKRYRWRTVDGQDYLLRIGRGQTNGTSVGARSEKTEALFEQGKLLEAQVENTWKRLIVKGRMLKAGKAPMIGAAAGKALRALDTAGLLGVHVRVVGSTALAAYEVAAAVKLEARIKATEDIDITWVSEEQSIEALLLSTLKQSDNTWTLNTEKTFQIRNSSGDILDVLIAPSLFSKYPAKEPIRAISTPGQDWLLGGVPLERVAIDQAGLPVRIVAPDPRLFALHKLVMSDEEGRRIEKRSKDKEQGIAILEMIRDHMPEYPMDEEFVATLPKELKEAWQKTSLYEEESQPRAHGNDDDVGAVSCRGRKGP